jgi:hypothetical protein
MTLLYHCNVRFRLYYSCYIFYIRSPQQNPKNKPNREVFMHFFGMEVTWK